MLERLLPEVNKGLPKARLCLVTEINSDGETGQWQWAKEASEGREIVDGVIKCSQAANVEGGE